MENDGNDNRIESKIRKGWESDDDNDNDNESDSLSQSFAEDYGSPRRIERESMLAKRQEELAARRRALEVAKRRNYERSLNVEMMRAGLMPVPSADKSEEEFSRCGMTRRKWILWSVVFVILTGGLVAYFAAPRSAESIPMPPTPAPTFGPLGLRTKSPTTPKPTTDQPTRSPTLRPTMAPTPRPTTAPPTGTPSIHPTRTPTIQPSKAPTHTPTITPPTGTPSIHPTGTPTIHPSKAPTRYPSVMPSEGPSTSSNPTGRMDGYYTPFDRPIRIACVGDSLTRGVSNIWGMGGVDYPKQLQGLLGDMFTHRNLGINSVTALRGMSTSYTERWGFTASLEYQPDIYLLMLGTNDSKYWETHSQSYRTDMEWILKTVKIETGARIIVGIPPWVNTPETEYGQIRNGILVNFIQPALRQLAISENVELVDMYKVTVNVPDALTNDGIHLNEKGYRILAEAWKSTIQCNQNGVCEVGETCSTCPGDCYRNCS